MTAGIAQTLTFEEAWPILQEEGINKLTGALESDGPPTHPPFTSQDYMRLYTVVYNACSPNPIGPGAQKFYDQYKKTFEEYTSCKVLPSLREKDDEHLLRELLRRWNNHLILTRWLSRFCHYLERNLIKKKNLPSLQDASYWAFYNLVFGEFNDQIRDAIVSLIDRARIGEQIDLALVKLVLDIYEKLSGCIGKSKLEHNTKDLEDKIIKGAAMFYSKNASDWIASMSYEDYMRKVDECLEQEKGRAAYYSLFPIENKVLEVVKHELLTVPASQLQVKQHIHDA